MHTTGVHVGGGWVVRVTIASGVSRSSRKSLVARLLAICAAATLLPACAVIHAEIEAAGAFGKSAATLAESVKSAYAQAPQDEADIRAGKFLVRANNDDYYPRAGALGITTFDGRLAAAGVLSAYGQALSSLLDSKTQNADIVAATDKLAAAVKRLPADVRGKARITDAEIVNAGKVLTVVAEAYVDFLRLEAIRSTVPALEPTVTKLCNMFARDFDPDKPGFAQVYFNAADRILDTAQKMGGDQAYQGRALVLPTFQRLDAIRTKTELSFSAVRKAATSCAKSSIALRKAVEEHEISFDDIADFANKAEAAYSAIAAFKPGK